MRANENIKIRADKYVEMSKSKYPTAAKKMSLNLSVAKQNAKTFKALFSEEKKTFVKFYTFAQIRVRYLNLI